jgi:hypothetical protein
MDDATAIKYGVVACIAALLIVGFVFRRLRFRRTTRRTSEVLARYFNGEVALDQVVRQAPEVASRGFTGSPEFQALVQAAFQRAAETRLAPYSLEVEKKLLRTLAALKLEFGLPDRYQNEGWKPGRE